MSREERTDRIARTLRAAHLRAALSRMALRQGRFRGHLIRRLVRAVGRLPRPGSARIPGGIHPNLIVLMPSAPSGKSGLGLGLAGGGGGSPGTGAARA